MSLVTSGLGHPGGLIVSGGLGSIIYVSPTGATYVRHSGAWHEVSSMYVFHSGSWQPAELYVHKSGNWVQAW